MILKPTIKGMKHLEKEQKPVNKETTPKQKKAKLPPDVYKPMFEPIRMLVRETPSSKSATSMVKQYIEISVKRYDDDEALPYLWLQMYQESDFYTGYLKGKCVYLPLEFLYDLIENFEEISDICDKMNI